MGLLKACFQATILSAISNLLGQTIAAYKENRPFQLETGPIIDFVLFSLLNTPPNYLWQELLEELFPAYTTATAARPFSEEKSPVHDANKTMSDNKMLPQRRHNLKNTIIKVLLDQTIGAAANAVIFIAGINAIQARTKGVSIDDITKAIHDDFWPLMIAAYKFWPLVSIVNFTFVPAEQRVVVGSAAGVAWGVFLSLFIG